MQEQDYLEQEKDHARATTAEDVDPQQLLRALIYQLHEVQKNLYADVKKFSEASHEAMSTQKVLKESVKDLSLIAPDLRRQFQDIIHSSVHSAIKSQEDSLGKRIVERIVGDTASLVKSLDTSVDNARRTLDRHMEERHYSRWVYVATGIVAGFVMMVGTLFFIKAYPTSLMGEQDFYIYQNGVLLSKAWSKLTDKEKERLHELEAEWGKKND